MISTHYRPLFFILLLALLVGGCAGGKIAVSPPSEAGRGSGARPVFPASEQRPVAGVPVSPEYLSPDLASDQEGGQPLSAAPVKEEPQTLVQIERYLRLPAVSQVDRRMAIYGEKLSRWKNLAEQAMDQELLERRPPEWSECFMAVDQLFQGHSRLLEEVLKQELPTVREEELSVDPWQLYYDDIAYLESGCDEVLQATSDLLAGRNNHDIPARAQESEDIVGQYVDQGLNEEAVLAFQNLRHADPDRELKEETRRMYGMALLRTGQLDKAGRELSQVLESMSPSPEKRSLRRLVADLFLAMGQLEEAYANYRQLAEYYESGNGDERWVADQLALLGLPDLRDAPELSLYLKVLRDFIRFNGHTMPEGMKSKVEKLEKVYPASPLTVRARQMFWRIEDALREWLKGELDQAGLYLAARDFASAKALLERLLVEGLEPPGLELVQLTLDNVLREESQYLVGQRILADQNQSEKWDRAVTLLDSGQYDKAISEFNALFNTDYDVPARQKSREAMEAAATKMRRQAASLFVKARKAGDYDEKLNLLEESWVLLSKIITSYPEVMIIDKVRQNQALIEQQIEQLNPLLLRKLKGVEVVTETGPDPVTEVVPSADFR